MPGLARTGYDYATSLSAMCFDTAVLLVCVDLLGLHERMPFRDTAMGCCWGQDRSYY